MVVRRAARYRAEDIWDTPDVGNRYEVIDGDLYVTPPPVVAHQGHVGPEHVLLGLMADRHAVSVAMCERLGVSGDDVRRAIERRISRN